MYKNNARALLSHILSILNLDWLLHARTVRGVYELLIISLSQGVCRYQMDKLIQQLYLKSTHLLCYMLIKEIVEIRDFDLGPVAGRANRCGRVLPFPDSKKMPTIGKKRGEIEKRGTKSGKREKSGKRGKMGKKRQKLGTFFHFAPPDR